MFQKTRIQLALSYTTVMALILLSLGWGLWWFILGALTRETDRTLEQLAQQVQWSLPVRHRQTTWEVIVDRSVYFQPNGEARLIWFAPNRDLVRATVDPELFNTPLRLEVGWKTISTRNRIQYRQFTRQWTYEGQVLGYLSVLQPLTNRDQLLDQLSLALTFGIPITLLLSGAGGWLLAGTVIAPLRQRFAQLQQFTADASHELRTPIAAIQTNVQVLLMDPTVTRDQQRGLEAIERLSQRLGILVGDLLFLARNEGPLPTLDRQQLDLGLLLLELVEEQQPLADQKKLTLSLHLGTLVPVLGNGEQLARLVLNLISNALSYTPAGGTVSIRAWCENEHCYIAVQDTGIGIAPEDQAQVFERFYRVDQARARSQGGTGLGLAIAQTIARNHGGAITLESSPRQGSIFTLRLPL